MQQFSLIVIWTLFISSFATATEPLIYDGVSPAGPLSVHIYQNDGHWSIQAFVMDEDGLPQVTKPQRVTFSSRDKALEFAKKQYGIKDENINTTSLTTELALELPSQSPTFGVNDTSNILWKAEGAWSWEMEQKCSAFTKENLDVDFYKELGIENDCADIAYQERIICARIFNLPLGFRLAGGGWFTNETMKSDWKKLKTVAWKKGEFDFTNKDPEVIKALKTKVVENLKNDKRLHAALEYVANTTYTHTLQTATYPIAISKESLIEGTIFLYIHGESGHTLIINEVNTDASVRLPLYTLSSTVPKEVRPLYESPFFDAAQPENGIGGFRRFLWPQVVKGKMSLVDPKKMPHYSMEQYSPEFMVDPNAPPVEEGKEEYKNFSLFVFKRLNPNFDPLLRITEGLNTLKEMIKNRDDVVIKGYDYCVTQKKDCSDGTAGYEDWSTPSRDKRIIDLMNDMENYTNALMSFPEISEAWNNANETMNLSINNQDYLLKSLHWSWRNNYFSSTPTDTPDVRWGLSPQFFANKIEREIQPLLAKRIQKIQSNQCAKGHCEIFSTAFDQHSSFTEDAQLREKFTTYIRYCSEFKTEQCQLMKESLEKKSTPVTQHQNLLTSWNNIPVYNSDPRTNDESRWGNFNSQLILNQLQGTFQSILTSNNKYDFIKTSEIVDPNTYKEKLNYYLIDKINGQIIYRFSEAPNAVTNGAYLLHPNESLLLRVDKGRLTATNLSGDVLYSSQVPELGQTQDDYYDYQLNWLSESQILIYQQSSKKLVQLEVNQTNAAVLNVFTDILESYQSEHNKNFYFSYDYATLDILNFENGNVKKTTIPVSHLNLPKIQGATPRMVSRIEESFLFEVSYFLNQKYKTEYFFINGVSLEAHRIDWRPDIQEIGSGVFSQSEYNDDPNKSSVQFQFYDQNFKKIKTITLSGNCSDCYSARSHGLINMKNGKESALYKINTKSMTVSKVAQLKSPEHTVQQIFGDWAIINHDEMMTLIDLKEGKPHLTGHSISLGVNYSSGSSSSSERYISIQRGLKIDEKKSIQQTLVIDLQNISMGSLLTSSFMSESYECEPNAVDGCYGGDGEDGYVVSTSPIIPLKGTVLEVLAPLEPTQENLVPLTYISPFYEWSSTLVFDSK